MSTTKGIKNNSLYLLLMLIDKTIVNNFFSEKKIIRSATLSRLVELICKCFSILILACSSSSLRIDVFVNIVSGIISVTNFTVGWRFSSRHHLPAINLVCNAFLFLRLIGHDRLRHPVFCKQTGPRSISLSPFAQGVFSCFLFACIHFIYLNYVWRLYW